MRVLVIGGGFAGVAAAATLRDRGAAVTLLERARTLGGRARSDEFDGVTIDTGTQLISTMCRRTLRLLGAHRSAALRPARGRDAYVRAGVRHPLQFGSLRSLLGFGGISTMEKLRLARHVLPILAAHGRELDAGADRVMSSHDRQDARTFIASHVGTHAADVLVEPPLNGFYSLRGDETALAFFLMLGRYGGEGEVLAPVSGWSLTLEHLLRDIAVERGATARKIRGDGQAMMVHGDAGASWPADGVVIATSPHEAAALLAALVPPDSAALGWLRHVALRPTWTLALALDKAMPRDAFGLFHDASHARMVAACAVYGARARAGWPTRDVVLAWPTPAAVLAMRDAPTEQLTRVMLPEVEELLPPVRGHIVRARVYRFTEGTPIPAPGFAADRARGRALLRAIDLPITFAGDYLTVPLVEGAVASGEQGALQLIGKLGGGRTRMG